MASQVCLSSISSVYRITLTVCSNYPRCGRTYLARSTSPRFPIGFTNIIGLDECDYANGYVDAYVDLLRYSYFYRLLDEQGGVISNTLIVSLTLTDDTIDESNITA